MQTHLRLLRTPFVLPSLQRWTLCTFFGTALLVFTTPVWSQSVVTPKKPISPRDYILGDTVKYSDRINIPGEVTVQFTPEQDSAYRHDLQVDITATSRFAAAARQLRAALQYSDQNDRPLTLSEAIMQAVNIPAEMYMPTAMEVTQYQIGIANSQYVPGVLLRPMGTGNLQASFGAIGRFFGVVEDVSPEITYDVDETMEVTVVVYSTQAKIIRTLFSGIQGPGRYRMRWNGLDERSLQVANGDYVAEVRLGDVRIQRKRIVWPPEN